MGTIATQCYNKIISTLSPEEINSFNQNWIRKTKFPRINQWYTEWYCNPMKLTFSLLHAPTMPDVKIQKKGEIILDAMSFFDDVTAEKYTTLQRRHMMLYESNLLTKFYSYIPGKNIHEQAVNIGIMFLGSLLGDIPLIGVYSKKQSSWIHRNEISLLRLTKNKGITSNKIVLTCSKNHCDINNDCNDALYMPTLVYY